MNLKNILCSTVAALALFGCQTELEVKDLSPRISLGESSIKVTGLGDNKSVSVSSTVSWTAESDAAWAHVAPAYGTQSTTSVSILIDENGTGAERTATVTLTSVDGLVNSSLSIVQSGDLVPAGAAIRDAETFMDFLSVAQDAVETDEFFVLEDIDMGGATITPAVTFAGKLDGQGHKIYNFKVVSKNSSAGVILDNEGSISNIVFGSKDGKSWDRSSTISFDESVEVGANIGLIAATGGNLENVVNFATVIMNAKSLSDNYSAAGGVVGRIIRPCTIRGCENYGSVEFTGALAYKSSMGGVVGFNDQAGAEVIGCKNYGEVAKNTKVEKEFTLAGVVGRSDKNMLIEDCENHGSVIYSNNDAPGSYIHMGGIIAAMYNGTEVKNCVNSGAVTSSILQVNRVGGIAGTMNTGGTIEGCTNNAEVKLVQVAPNNNWQALGGILGFQEKGSGNVVRNNVNNGAVYMEVENKTTHNNKINAGGIVGLGILAIEIEGNVNNGSVTIVNKADGNAYAGGIVGWIKGAGSFTKDNVNKGKVSCQTSDDAASYAGGVIGYSDASTTTSTNDKNEGEIVCANTKGAGSVAGLSAGSLIDCTAAGSVNGTVLDDSNFTKLAVGTSTGKVENLKSPGGASATTVEISLDKAEARVEADAVSASFNVKSNVAWTVATSAAWITDYTKSGEKDGTVNISFAANDSVEDRVAVFTVTAKDADPLTFTLTQGKVLDSAPHCIASAEELALFAAAASAETPDFSRWADASGVINITADIDAAGLTCFPIAVLPAETVLDGGNHKIYNVKVASKTNNSGLIAVNSGTVKNLLVGTKDGSSYDGVSEIAFDATVTDALAAGVVATNSGKIENVTNYAAVNVAVTTNTAKPGFAGVAGAIGAENASILNCKNYGTVNVTGTLAGETSFGGILGYSAFVGVTVKSCYNYAAINTSVVVAKVTMIGGIVARIGAQITVEDCHNLGAITYTQTAAPATWAAIGGINGAAYNNATITGCTNSAKISSDLRQVNRIGGICGVQNSSGLISNNENTGDVELIQSGDAFANWEAVGGIVGFQEKQMAGVDNVISGNTNSGNVKIVSVTTNATVGAGGIVGVSKLLQSLSDNVNKGSVYCETANTAMAGGIIGYVYDKAQPLSNNTNSGAVEAKGGNAKVIAAGGVAGYTNNAGITLNGDKSDGAVKVSSGDDTVAYAGAVAGWNKGSATGCGAGGSVNATALDATNFEALAFGKNDGSATGTVLYAK